MFNGESAKQRLYNHCLKEAQRNKGRHEEHKEHDL
jgi:hypothetical protein